MSLILFFILFQFTKASCMEYINDLKTLIAFNNYEISLPVPALNDNGHEHFTSGLIILRPTKQWNRFDNYKHIGLAQAQHVLYYLRNEDGYPKAILFDPTARYSANGIDLSGISMKIRDPRNIEDKKINDGTNIFKVINYTPVKDKITKLRKPQKDLILIISDLDGTLVKYPKDKRSEHLNFLIRILDNPKNFIKDLKSGMMANYFPEYYQMVFSLKDSDLQKLDNLQILLSVSTARGSISALQDIISKGLPVNIIASSLGTNLSYIEKDTDSSLSVYRSQEWVDHMFNKVRQWNPEKIISLAISSSFYLNGFISLAEPKHINYFRISFDKLRTDFVLADFKQMFKQKGFSDLSITVSRNRFVDIVPSGINKAGIARFIKNILAPFKTLVFGDSDSDIPMLNLANGKDIIGTLVKSPNNPAKNELNVNVLKTRDAPGIAITKKLLSVILDYLKRNQI